MNNENHSYHSPEDDQLLQQNIQQQYEEEQQQEQSSKEDFQSALENSDKESVGDFLQADCMIVEMELGSLPTSFSIPREVKEQWAKTTDTETRRVRGSLAILSPDAHPYLKEGNALKRQITAILDQYTLPKQQVAVSSQGITDDGAKLVSKKESGKRIILKALVDEFTQKITPAIDAYIAWGAGLDERLEAFRSADQEALGEAWDLMESKYPKSLSRYVTVVEPTFSAIDVTVDFEKVAPRSAEQLRKTNAAWLDATVGAACDEIVTTLVDNVRDVVRQLGTRIRLNPDVTGKYGHLRDAEVKKIVKHEESPEKVPADSYLLVLKPKAGGAEKEVIIPVADYKSQLHPFETDEHCKLYESGVSKLMTLAEKIGNIQSMLGENGPKISTVATTLQDTLVSFGSTPAAITKEMKSGSFVRNTARTQLEGIANALEDQLVKREKKQKVHRRRIG